MKGIGVHPAIAYTASVIDNMPEKTGKSIEEWVALTLKSGAATEKERIAWLQATHRLGATTAGVIAVRSLGRNRWETDPQAYLQEAPRMVDAMYSGQKAHLRPLSDALLEAALQLGDDVRCCPCRTILPLYRRHVIAQIKPATLTRIDLGFALGDTPAAGRLRSTGGFEKKDRITHRIPITTATDIDDEVRGWLRRAYERDA